MAEAEKNEILLAIEKLGSKIDNLQSEVSELKVEVIPEMKNEFSELKVDIIPEMQEEIRKISKSVAVIELEHGEKLDLLFDIFDMQQEKLKSHDRKIQLCDKRLNRHDDEIYYLKEFLRA